MEIKQHAYQGEESRRQMMALAHTQPEENLHVIDLPYRLSSWALDTPKNIGLWSDESGNLMAWAVLQTPFWTIDYSLHPDAPFGLQGQVLAWANQQAIDIRETFSGHPMWFCNVFRRQEERIHDLEAAGFANQADVGQNSWSKVLMCRAATEPLSAAEIPAGFTIRPLAGISEIVAYVRLHRAAFGSESMTEGWRHRILTCPEYQPAIDLVAVAPDGELASFCICWFDPTGRDGRPSGQIEPLGVAPAFHRMGLGRSLLWEGLQRLYQMGAEYVFVETDNQSNAALGLYQSGGFRIIEDVLVYRKDYPDPAENVAL